MRSGSRHSIPFALLALVLAPPATAQFEAVKARIQRKLTEGGVPSLAVAVARNGKIVWEAGYGWADREKRIPATERPSKGSVKPAPRRFKPVTTYRQIPTDGLP